MNQPFLLHIVERLEAFLGKLPATIQKPVLHELTPLKELFLQQRPPRFVLTGSNKLAVRELLPPLFGTSAEGLRERLMEVFRWQKIGIGNHGTIELLDARGADDTALIHALDEVGRRSADVFLHVGQTNDAGASSREVANLVTLHERSARSGRAGKIVGIVIEEAKRVSSRNNDTHSELTPLTLRDALQNAPAVREHLLHVVTVRLDDENFSGAQRLLALLARELPNDVRVEIVRISRDRTAQADIAQLLVKSTAAICAAIGTQPIPLADLPILTSLQLVMVSGIMYVSGRERSLRAATEFVAAVGANVGAGMLLREGARTALKFFPGWGNVISGMIAGAGTYAIGKAATVYFVEGVSLKEARRTYLSSRRRRDPAAALPEKPQERETISRP